MRKFFFFLMSFAAMSVISSCDEAFQLLTIDGDSYSAKLYKVEEMFDKLMEYKEALAPYVANTFDIVHDAVAAGKNVLLEGQLGSLKS